MNLVHAPPNLNSIGHSFMSSARYEMKVAKASFSQTSSHHLKVTKFPNHI